MVKRQAATRIIGGKYKGTKLVFKPNKMLRPTESKTKETLFNWLLNDLDKKKCLDMFAGTGSLGLEAISRGASNVVFIEKQLKLSQSIIDTTKRLRIEKMSRVINTNSISFDVQSTFEYTVIEHNLTSETYLIVDMYDEGGTHVHRWARFVWPTSAQE